MPVSFFGYVFGCFIELEFIVINTRIDAKNSEMKIENPAPITEPRYKIEDSSTANVTC
jgi:hypothetical protein